MNDVIDISVIAPCLNEGENLNEFVDRVRSSLLRRRLSFEVIIVDDGSTDNTPDILRELDSRISELKVLTHEENLGIDQAWKTGLREAVGKYVCLIDSDLQYLPEDIVRLYNEITFSNVDMVQGARNPINRERNERFYLSRGLNRILNLLFLIRSRDIKSGFVLARREVLQASLACRNRYFYFQTFIRISAVSKGFSVKEIECLFDERKAGTSFMKGFPVKVVLRSIVDVILGFVEFNFFRTHHDTLADYLLQKDTQPTLPELSPGNSVRRRLFFHTLPVHKWVIRKPGTEFYKALNQTQWLKRGEIVELQLTKLRSLLGHAYNHVPFYREKFRAAGIQPDDIRTLEDLQAIPLLGKTDIRENLYFGLLSDNHSKSAILRIHTSGSTGEPFSFFVDKFQLEMRWAATLRGVDWTGYEFGQRQMRLWHQTIGMNTQKKVKEYLDAVISNRVFIPAFEMSTASMRELFEKIRKFKPVFMDGYAECFNMMALYIKEQGISGIKVPYIMSSAQELPRQSRELISEALGSEIFDKYGSREFSGIAYECPQHNGHHVVAENYIVELIKDGRPALPGEMGEVVITDLNNYCMPFIRYRVGDLAEAMEDDYACACGRGLPLIGNIKGRTQAIIIGSAGQLIPGTFFAHFFKDYDHIVRQYQVQQHSLGSIRLLVVKGSRYSDSGFRKMLVNIQEYLGSETNIDVEFLGDIPLGRTGKHTGCISYLNLDFQNMMINA